MMKRKTFIHPAILQELTLLPETPVLTGSVSDNTTVISTGQAVEEYDFSQDDFNHQWE